jgi:hypothetical protein
LQLFHGLSWLSPRRWLQPEPDIAGCSGVKPVATAFTSKQGNATQINNGHDNYGGHDTMGKGLTELGLWVLLATLAPALSATAQSALPLDEDPADLFGYSVDITESEGGDVAAKVRNAVERSDATAEEIKMIFSVDNFHFVSLDAGLVKDMEPILARQQQGVTNLRTALSASALFHTAMESERIDTNSVVAVDLTPGESGLPSDKQAVIYVAE